MCFARHYSSSIDMEFWVEGVWVVCVVLCFANHDSSEAVSMVLAVTCGAEHQTGPPTRTEWTLALGKAG